MKDWARKFYSSDAWQNTRKAYGKYVGNLCERCASNGIIKAGEIVHHKTPLTPDNINDPCVTLNWNNLMLVCRECHAKIHYPVQRRWSVDEFGNVTPLSRNE